MSDDKKKGPKGPSIIIPGIMTTKTIQQEVNRRLAISQKAAKAAQAEGIHDPLTQAHWHSGQVRREEVKDDGAKKSSNALRAIGLEMRPTPGARYIGSCAVHVYHTEALETAMYIEQAVTGGTAEIPSDWSINSVHRFFNLGLESLGRYVEGLFNGVRRSRRSGF